MHRPVRSYPEETALKMRSVRDAADGTLECFVQHLAERRVCVDHHGKFFNGRAGGNRIRALLNKVRGVDANNVDAEQVTRALVEEYLRRT